MICDSFNYSKQKQRMMKWACALNYFKFFFENNLSLMHSLCVYFGGVKKFNKKQPLENKGMQLQIATCAPLFLQQSMQ